MIKLICKRCGAIKQIECSTLHSRIAYLYEQHYKCDSCKHVFDWKHARVIVQS